MVEQFCKKCKCKTEHSEHGFRYNNRRYRCAKCGYEEWDGETEMEAIE